jgi:hypothetical protein
MAKTDTVDIANIKRFGQAEGHHEVTPTTGPVGHFDPEFQKLASSLGKAPPTFISSGRAMTAMRSWFSPARTPIPAPIISSIAKPRKWGNWRVFARPLRTRR